MNINGPGPNPDPRIVSATVDAMLAQWKKTAETIERWIEERKADNA